MTSCPFFNKSKGFTLVEPILVIAALALMFLLILSLPSAVNTVNKSRSASIAKTIVGKKIESLRRLGYTNLALTGSLVDFTDPDLGSLPSPTARYRVDICPVTICTLNEKAKQVQVVVSWTDTQETKSVEVSTIVGEGGLGQ